MKIKLLLTSLLLSAFLSLDARSQEPAAPKSNQITVNVLGEVNKPSRVALPAGATVLDALASAGGATREGNLLRVRIIHKTAADKADTSVIDLKSVLDGRSKDVALRDGDTIHLLKAIF